MQTVLFYKTKQVIKNNKHVIFNSLFVSFVFFILYTFIISPIASKLGVFSEGIHLKCSSIVLYLIFFYPIYFFVIYTTVKLFYKIRFLRAIFYPIFSFNIIYSLLLILLIFGGTIIWYFLFMIPCIIFILVFACICGIIQDIKTIINISK